MGIIKNYKKVLKANFKNAAAAAAKSLQSCPTLCDPRDATPPGSAVPGILQARILEWGAIAFSNFKNRAREINMPGKIYNIHTDFVLELRFLLGAKKKKKAFHRLSNV